MLPAPHGGTLVRRVLTGEAQAKAKQEAASMATVNVSADVVSDIINITTGAYSPLEGFLDSRDLESVLDSDHLSGGAPWTIPIVLDVEASQAKALPDRVALAAPNGDPVAVMNVTDRYGYDKERYAQHVFGTTDSAHPGVAGLLEREDTLLGGVIDLIAEPAATFPSYTLDPIETRVLFEAKGWRTVVGFQTRNVPHLGHEYVQKSALSFVDGLFINPVIGRKKSGDFTDDAILTTYEALLAHYYRPERAVMAVLRTEMRYAGPKEAIFHAIVRKNLGCTHFIVGRDHAGVGSYYTPYAAQEIFDDFPDLGITPMFFTSFFMCHKCGSVVNEKTCPHGPEHQEQFSGTLLRNLMTSGEVPEGGLVRPEVAKVLIEHPDPLVA